MVTVMAMVEEMVTVAMEVENETFKQFQEGVAALKVGSKLLPKLMIGVGAGGTLFKAQEYIKRNLDQRKGGQSWGILG